MHENLHKLAECLVENFSGLSVRVIAYEIIIAIVAKNQGMMEHNFTYLIVSGNIVMVQYEVKH